MIKDRRFCEILLPLSIFNDWGMEAVKILMEDFVVIEAKIDFLDERIRYMAWHPELGEVFPYCKPVQLVWVFKEHRVANELVKVEASLGLGVPKVEKTIHFNRSITAEKPSYEKEEFSV